MRDRRQYVPHTACVECGAPVSFDFHGEAVCKNNHQHPPETVRVLASAVRGGPLKSADTPPDHSARYGLAALAVIYAIDIATRLL